MLDRLDRLLARGASVPELIESRNPGVGA